MHRNPDSGGDAHGGVANRRKAKKGPETSDMVKLLIHGFVGADSGLTHTHSGISIDQHARSPCNCGDIQTTAAPPKHARYMKNSNQCDSNNFNQCVALRVILKTCFF